MSMGIPYDSEQGRDWAAGLTAIMCGQAYLTSARIAAVRPGRAKATRSTRSRSSK
jgi:ribonucleoside-diphosphate reductase alpha chain